MKNIKSNGQGPLKSGASSSAGNSNGSFEEKCAWMRSRQAAKELGSPKPKRPPKKEQRTHADQNPELLRKR